MLARFNIIIVETILEQKSSPIFCVFIIAKKNTRHSSKAENDRVSIVPVTDKLKIFGVVRQNRQIKITELLKFESFILLRFCFYIIYCRITPTASTNQPPYNLWSVPQ